MLRLYKTFMFDADGTLWNSNALINGTVLLLQYLKKTGRNVFLITNNSTKSVEQYKEKCDKLGVALETSDIICSANVAAYTLANKGVKGPLYVIGEEGIGIELDKVGIDHFGIGPDNTKLADFDVSHLKNNVRGVIVGFDCHFNYLKLMKATNYILRGNPFYATNEDALFPNNDYSMPGTGPMVASVRKACGIEPLVFGKPGKPTWDIIKAKCGAVAETTLMVGDRLDTDIEFGKAFGMHTACVLTGVTSNDLLKEVRADPAKEKLLGPEHVFPSVLEMYHQLKEEDEKAGIVA